MESVIDILESKFGAKRDEKAKWDACVVVPKEFLHNAVEFLKNDPSMQFDMLPAQCSRVPEERPVDAV